MMATDAADGHVTGPDAVDKNAIFAGANLVAQADEDGREITHAIWRRHSKLVSSVAAPDDADGQRITAPTAFLNPNKTHVH